MKEPQLQPPGAGLPSMELFVSRFLVFPYFCRTVSWEKAEQIFNEEGRRILALAREFGPGAQKERILIPRPRGLEDSSRFWSPAMVLEHLVLVGTEMREVVVGLSHGFRPDREASTAAVKPDFGIGIEEFEEFLANFWGDLDGRVRNKASQTTYAHPWFGALNLQQWQRLLALHQRLHRQQLEVMRAQKNDAAR